MAALLELGQRAWIAGLFAVASLLAMWLGLRWLGRVAATGALSAVLVLGMLAAVVAGIGLSDLAARRELAQLRAMVEGLGPTYAMELTRLGHARLPDGVSPDDPLYLALIEAEKRWLEANRSVADIYTFRRLSDGTTVFLVDSETDYDHDGVFVGEREARTDPGEVYDTPDPELDRALAGEPSFSPEPVSDRWGTWVSAYVPMRDGAGRVEAVLGIDYPAEAWVRAATAARARVLVQTGTMQLVFLAAVLWVGMARAESERRRVAEERTRDAYERAERASHAKSDFLASMSHEIRTPMNGVIGMAELLLATNPSLEHRHYAETILGSARHLLTLINELLDLSKAEAGRIELELADGSVADVIEESALAFEGAARSKGLEIGCRIPDDLPEPLLFDALRLRQVVMNLVGNAVKFTSSGRVLVAVEHLGSTSAPEGAPPAPVREQIRISVSDTGPGVPPALRDRIFEAFAQADASIARRHGGTGLGLAICKKLVEKMGGEIGVEDAAGAGACFWLRLPLARGEKAAEEHSASRGALAGRVALLAPRSDARAALEGLLGAWNLAFRSCESGPDALAILRNAAARREPFDAILVDEAGLDRAGEWLGALRQDAPLRRLPVVVLASAGVPIDASDPAVIAVAKPYRRSVLFNALAEALRAAPRDAAVAGAPAPGSPTTATRPLSVLVVEDNVVNQQVATAFLRLLGCTPQVANDGREGVERVATGDYEIVFMDVQMPGMDGLAATRAIRAQQASAPGGKRLPIVALTAHALGEDREACLAAGMDDYLPKPLTVERIHETLRRWVPAAFAPSAREPEEDTEMSRPRWEAHESLDRTVLDRLRALGREIGSDVIGDAIGAYRTASVGALAEMRAAIGSGDADALRRAAHKLKGGSLQLGANRVAAIATELEERGRAGAAAGAGPLLAQLERELGVAQDELAKERGAS